MKAEYTTKDQNWADETTIYWFEITESNDLRIEVGEVYGISDCNGELTIVDADNCPLTDYDELLPVLVVTDEIIGAN